MHTWLQRACKNWKNAISNPREDIFAPSYAAIQLSNGMWKTGSDVTKLKTKMAPSPGSPDWREELLKHIKG